MERSRVGGIMIGCAACSRTLAEAHGERMEELSAGDLARGLYEHLREKPDHGPTGFALEVVVIFYG
jgi:hypothetical protein